MNYEFKTTFWSDFTIADHFGIAAIKDTYNRAFKEWKNDYIYLTELVIVLNWKLWQHWEKGNEAVAQVYSDLWSKTHDYALNHLKGEKFSYYYDKTN